MSLLDEIRAAGIKPQNSNIPPSSSQYNNSLPQQNSGSLLQEIQSAGIKPEGQPQIPQSQTQQDGFFKGLVKGVEKPFLEVGATIKNVADAGNSLISGGFNQNSVNQANQNLHNSYDVPFFGETKPAFTGDESLGESFKKQAGYGAEFASDFLGGEGVGSIAKGAGEGLVKQGIKQGVKFGALSGGLGEGGRALQDKDSSFTDFALRTGGGVLGGGVLGGVIGGVSPIIGKTIGNVVEKIKNPASAEEQKAILEALNIIKPQLSSKEKQAALNAGRGKATGLLKTTEIIPSNRDYEIAEATKGIVSKKNSNIENIDALFSSIENDANEVINGLKENDAIYNRNQIRSQLEKIKNSDERRYTLGGDEAAQKAYDSVINLYLTLLDNKPKNLSGVLEARKELYQIAKNSKNNFFDKTGDVKNIAVQDVGQAANTFIADHLPPGDPFKDLLRKQSLKYEAISNLSKKSAKDIGTNVLQRFARQHPKLTKAATIGGAALAGKLGLDRLTR